MRSFTKLLEYLQWQFRLVNALTKRVLSLKHVVAEELESLRPKLLAKIFLFQCYKLVFEELRVVHLKVATRANFYAPLVLVVEVQRPTRLLLSVLAFAAGALAIACLLLHPREEAHVELPASPLELLCGKELLVRTDLIVEGEEQRLDIHATEVYLPVVHGLRREITIYCLISLHAPLQISIDAHGYCVVDRQGTPDVDTMLVLHQRHVEERTVYHVQQ